MQSHVWGGSEELWSQAALLLQKQGHQVTASVRWWPEPAAPIAALQDTGAQMEWRRLESPQGTARRIAQKIKRRLRPESNPWLETLQPDLVVISMGDPYSGVPWAERCQASKLPYVFIVQAASERWWPEDTNAAQAAQCYEAAAASYFVAQGNIDLVGTQIAANLTGAKVVRNPFSVPYEHTVDWPEETEPLRLACVGRLEPNAKGQDLLFQALKQEKWQQRDLEVSLYGKGPSAATLKRLQELWGLHKVRFAGFTPDIAEVWKTHHLLVLPSRYEGLPITVVEAMLCGRPVVVTDVSGNAELVEEGKTGFIAAAATAQHLDDALERAWAHRAEWQQMGRNAGVRVRAQVPADPAAEFCRELISKII